MWLVNSDRSSSLIVCATLALEPWTVTLPALDGRAFAGACSLSLTLSYTTAFGHSPVPTRSEKETHLDPVLELDLSTGVDTNVLESLARTIIGLAASLQGVQDSGLVYAAWRVCR